MKIMGEVLQGKGAHFEAESSLSALASFCPGLHSPWGLCSWGEVSEASFSCNL